MEVQEDDDRTISVPSTSRTSLDTTNSDLTQSTNDSDKKNPFFKSMNLDLTPYSFTLHKRKKKDEGKSIEKRASVFTVPGEDLTSLSDKSVSNLLGIGQEYKLQNSEERKVNREKGVQTRKKTDTLSPLPNIEERNKEVTSKIQQLVISEYDIQDASPMSPFSPEVIRDTAVLLKASEKLYQKKSPSEWIARQPSESVLRSYELTLACLLYAIDASKSKRESLSQFSQKDFKALRKVYNITDERHKQIISRAAPVSQYCLLLLEHRLETLEHDPIFSKGAFADEQTYASWIDEQKIVLNDWIKRMKAEPEFVGNLSVKVLEARDLVPKKNATSDPFCTVHISRHQKENGIVASITKKKYDKQQQKTQIVKASLDPVWCEDFGFSVGADFEKYDLKVLLWDNDTILNHYLGEVLIPLGSFSDQLKQDQWYPLVAGKSHETTPVSGDVHLLIHLTYRKKPTDTKPPFTLNFPNQVEIHQSYRELLYKLIQLENTDLRSNEIQPLSEVSQILLDEFALRYGVGTHYRLLVHLEILVEFFRYQLRKSFVSYVMQILLEIEASSTDNVTMTRREEEMFRVLCADLKKQVENIFRIYKHFFKDKKMDGTLSLLIKVYLIMKQSAREDPDIALTNFIKSANDTFYDMLMVQLDEEAEAKESTGEEVDNDPKRRIITICDAVMTSIEEDIQLYKTEFPMTVDTVTLAAETLRERLVEALKPILTSESHITSDTFDLYFKIMEFNSFLEEKAPSVKGVDVGPYFTPLINHWIDQTRVKLKEWAHRMISSEKWEPLDESDEFSLLHSNSVVDLFHSIHEAVNFLLTVKTNLRSTMEYFIRSVVKEVVTYYIEAVRQSSIQALATNQSTIEIDQLVEVVKKQRKKHTVQLAVTKDLCVRLNDIDMTQTLLMDLTAYVHNKLKIEEELEPFFDDTFAMVRASQAEINEIITNKMNRDISVALQLLADKNSVQSLDPENDNVQRLEPLFAYLNIQLQVLSDYLYVGIFQKILRGAFIMVVKDLEKIIVPFELKDKTDRREQAKIVEINLADIESFFSADGEGLSETFVGKYTALLRTIFKLFDAPTEELIAMYNTLYVATPNFRATLAPAEEESAKKNYAEPEPSPLTHDHVVSILACRKKVDKAAKKFLNGVKQGLRNRDLRRHFNLDYKEEVIEKFSCPNEGQLYVTTNFMCFEPMRGVNRIQIPLGKISTVKVAGHALEVVMNDLAQERIPNVSDRLHCLEVLKERARTLGNIRLLECLVADTGSVSQGSSTESIHSTEGSRGSLSDTPVRFRTPTHKRTTSTASSTSEKSVESDDVDDKSKEQKKLEKFRKKYHQDSEAVVLQEYKCHYKYLGVGKPGKIKITQKYLLFNSKLAPKLILAFDRFKEIKKVREGGKDRLKITVEFEDKSEKKFVFSHFPSLEEASSFLTEMWNKNKH